MTELSELGEWPQLIFWIEQSTPTDLRIKWVRFVIKFTVVVPTGLSLIT
jgi:hypothetical protein